MKVILFDFSYYLSVLTIKSIFTGKDNLIPGVLFCSSTVLFKYLLLYSYVILPNNSPALEIISFGGEGVISVVRNLIPAEMSKMIRLALKGQLQEASKIHDLYLPLMNLNFIESSPIPVKYALARMGRLQEVYRLPLCSMRDDNKQKMYKELRKLDLF